MFDTVRVSIIMPAYNSAAYIRQTVESVQKQTFTQWELIIIDDGSTDNSLEIIRQIAESDPRVRYASQENGRQGKARNHGLKLAQSQLIAFLDADDLWLPSKLQLQVDALGQHKADLLFSDGFICLNNEMEREDCRFETHKGWLEGEAALRAFFESNQIPVSTVLCKREILDSVGCFDEQRDIQNCEDYDLWIRLIEKGYRFYGMSECLLRYRVHSASSTASEVSLIIPKLTTLLKSKSFRYPEGAIHLLKVYQRAAEYSIQISNYALLDKYIPDFINIFRPGAAWLLKSLNSVNKRRAAGLLYRIAERKLASFQKKLGQAPSRSLPQLPKSN